AAMHNKTAWQNLGSDKIHMVCRVIVPRGWCGVFYINRWALAGGNGVQGIRSAQRQLSVRF
ncbi:MAG: hypothetical protein J0653_04830, partial [Deltaproteobacteria bacterium]|nr:hypothetical protein [Deltaproteobacteria bacterium]